MQIHIKTELRTGVSHRALATAGCPVKDIKSARDLYNAFAGTIVTDQISNPKVRIVGKHPALGMGYGA